MLATHPPAQHPNASPPLLTGPRGRPGSVGTTTAGAGGDGAGGRPLSRMGMPSALPLPPLLASPSGSPAAALPMVPLGALHHPEAGCEWPTSNCSWGGHMTVFAFSTCVVIVCILFCLRMHHACMRAAVVHVLLCARVTCVSCSTTLEITSKQQAWIEYPLLHTQYEVVSAT